MLIKKLHDNFGISIENIYINSLSINEKKEIINLFEEHSLLVIKKQVINQQEQKKKSWFDLKLIRDKFNLLQ